MTKDDAIRAARQIGLSPGQRVVIQSNGQAREPHWHNNADERAGGATHVDGWLVWNNSGTYCAEKQHGR